MVVGEDPARHAQAIVHLIFTAVGMLLILALLHHPRSVGALLLLILFAEWWTLRTMLVPQPLEHRHVFDLNRNGLMSALPPAAVTRLHPFSPQGLRPTDLQLPHASFLIPGYSQTTSYCPIFSREFSDRLNMHQSGISWREVQLLSNPSLLALLGVSHVSLPRAGWTPQHEEAYLYAKDWYREIHEADEVILAELTKSAPRFEAAVSWRPETEPSEASEEHWSWQGDPSDWEATLASPRWRGLPPPHQPLGELQITPRRIRQNSMLVETVSEGGGVMLIGDVWWPGWRYTINGDASTEGRVGRAFGLIRYVPIPPGRNEVRIYYRPPGFRTGAGISAVGLGVWLPLFAAAQRTARRRRPGRLLQPAGGMISG